jgi:hypothetical protein
MRTALDGSQPLALLLQRMAESRARFDAVRELLPPGLRDTVRAGPLDDKGWSLLAPHSAGAAKLRQMLPMIEDALRARGWEGTPVKIRVQAPPTPA